jgi:hypothetical protein
MNMTLFSVIRLGFLTLILACATGKEGTSASSAPHSSGQNPSSPGHGEPVYPAPGKLSTGAQAQLVWGVMPYELFSETYTKNKTLSDHAPLIWGEAMTWNVMMQMKWSQGANPYYIGKFSNTGLQATTPDETQEEYEFRYHMEFAYLFSRAKELPVIFLQEVGNTMIDLLKEKFSVVEDELKFNRNVMLFPKGTKASRCDGASCLSKPYSSIASAMIVEADGRVYVNFHTKFMKNGQPNLDYTLKLLQRVYDEPRFKGKHVLAAGDFNVEVETLLQWAWDPTKNASYQDAHRWSFVTNPGLGYAGGSGPGGAGYRIHDKPIDGFIAFQIP